MKKNKKCLMCDNLLKRKSRKFCSLKCWGRYIKKFKTKENGFNWVGRKIIICPECKQTKQIRKNSSQKFCSPKCRIIFLGKLQRGEHHPNWKKRAKTECKLCHKELFIYPRLIKKRGNFCSIRHAAIWGISHNIKFKNTDIEVLIEKELLLNNIFYIKQVPLMGIMVVDFLLSNKIVIECDGNYWHSRIGEQEKDEEKTRILESNGYKVFRFRGDEIKKSPAKCINLVFETAREMLK